MDRITNKLLNDHLDELISIHGIDISFNDINDTDLETLTSFFIDAEMSSEWEWISESSDSSKLSRLYSNFLKSAQKDDMYVFINACKKSSIEYYAEHIKEALDNRVQEKREILRERELATRYQHADNGEYYYL